MPKDGWRDLVKKGLEEGRVYFKNCFCQGGVQFSYVIILGGSGGGGKILIHHTFLNPPGCNEWSVPNIDSVISINSVFMTVTQIIW